MGELRILVVEDDPVISLHLESIITQIVDAEVIVSQSAAEARFALQGVIDYAFLDVDVTDGTTYAVASALHARAIPFAFLSASNREHVPAALRSAPFVAKPYTPGDIADLLRDAGKC